LLLRAGESMPYARGGPGTTSKAGVGVAGPRIWAKELTAVDDFPRNRERQVQKFLVRQNIALSILGIGFLAEDKEWFNGQLSHRVTPVSTLFDADNHPLRAAIWR